MDESARDTTSRHDGIIWIAAGALSWWACANVIAPATPIDAAIPLVAAIIVLLGWLVRATPASAAVLCAIPLLLLCSIAFPEERTRLLAYGAVVAAAFCGAVLARTAFDEGDRGVVAPYALFAVAGTGLLRWIARDHVELVREVVVVAGVLAIVAAFGRRQSPLSVAVAIGAALATPAIPMRTLAIPFAFAAAVAVIRLASGRTPPAHVSPSLTVAGVVAILPLALMLALFAWSGAAARSLPYFWRSHPVAKGQVLSYALRPGEAVSIDLPPHTRGLLLSVANALRQREGDVVATIQPGGRAVRMGEISDWGFARREHYWTSHNSVPHRAAGTIHDYGYDSWVDGAGWIAAPRSSRITLTASPNLPPDVRLQVEALDVEPPR